MLFLLQDLLYQRSGWGARWRSATARLSYTKQSSSSVSVLDERFCVLWRVEISAHIALFSKKIICAAKSATLLLATKTVTHRATTCMEIDSKPRTLDNTTFRSTLEASWAIMFGRLGWDWIYEPFRLKGWIPDFLLAGKILVEIKPNKALEQFDEYDRYNEATQGTDYSNAEILLLGEAPLEKADLHDSPSLGWLIERPNDQRHHAVIWHSDLGYGLANDYSNWRCRITNAYEGGAGIYGPPWQTIRQMWFDSCAEARTLPIANPPDWPTKQA